MEYISSDTNVWIDFMVIGQLELPFKLDYIYLMFDEAVDNELTQPPELCSTLLSLGLQKTELTEEEFFLAEKFLEKYARLSIYDGIALAIAKLRGLILLSGDKSLRNAAAAENVRTLGTIGILDQLLKNGKITESRYKEYIKSLLELNGGKVRLPQKELEMRLNMNLNDLLF